MAQFYYDIYLAIVTILTVIFAINYTIKNPIIREIQLQRQRWLGWTISIFMILFIGLRPVDRVFVDMNGYDIMYNKYWGNDFSFETETTNIIFDNLFYFMACYMIPERLFFLLIAFIYFGCTYIAIKKIFKNDAIIVYLVFLGAFSTFSYGTNGIKAGAAAAIFYLAIAYREKKWLCILFALVSYGIHHSMQLVLASFLCINVVKNNKLYLFGWFVCLILAALHVTYFQELFGGYSTEHGAGYLAVSEEAFEEERHVSGFRPDFILYSAIPIFLGQFLFGQMKIRSPKYEMIFNTYTLSNSIWLLCMYASFINRIAYLSWFMYPLVISYPFLKNRISSNQNLYFLFVIFAHLGFTLFMHIVYYNL